jgi:hypothetical protein
MSSPLSTPYKGTDTGRRVVAPYITAWSAEQDPPVTLVERPGGGIAYYDETLADRDRHGVLWFRTPFRPGEGRPEFGKVHPLRQRRAMQRLLCQVCAGPANSTENGMLWLLQDHREDWPEWPNSMGVTEPPTCLHCVRLSLRHCPALRKSAAIVRAGSFVVSGVHGILHRGGPRPRAVGATIVRFEDPAIQWIRAVNLVRQLSDCVITPLTTAMIIDDEP